MVGVGVVECGADVLPVIAERRSNLFRGTDNYECLGWHQIKQGLKAVERQQVGDVGPLVGIAERGDLSQLTVLGGELGGRGDLN